MLLRHGVDTIFLTKNGRYLGRFAPAESKNVHIRKKQFDLLDDRIFGLEISKRIVSGKLASMMTLLMRINRTKSAGDLHEKAASIKTLISSLESAQSVDAVRGYEGRGSAIYFGEFSKGFVHDSGFRRRIRRPPTDPVNAVLSLLYTFLFNRVYSAVRAANIDPYPAFLHTPDYGRFSLVLDLMEEYRVIIADTLTLSLFNLKILQNGDFEIDDQKPEEETVDDPAAAIPDVTKDPYGVISAVRDNDLFDAPEQRMSEMVHECEAETGGKKPVKLKKEAFSRVIENFERKLQTEFYHLPSERKITYGAAMFSQAELYRKCIEGAANTYQPLILR
jgi:CRISPR-associated protein Cas1